MMKRILILLSIMILLNGCVHSNENLDRAMELRAKMIANDVSFDARITADYGDKSYTFAMQCKVDTKGEMYFTVIDPESISGICGRVSGMGGKLIFEDTVLAFDLMADGQISPVSAPWLVMKTLRGGYLTSCNLEGERLRLSIDDSYEEDALHLDIWLDDMDSPTDAEIYWQGRRLLSVEISNYSMG